MEIIGLVTILVFFSPPERIQNVQEKNGELSVKTTVFEHSGPQSQKELRGQSNAGGHPPVTDALPVTYPGK